MNRCVITSAARTAVGGYLGSLKTMEASELCSIAIKAVMERGGIGKNEVQEVIMGEVYGYTPNVARCGALLAGIPEEVPAFTVDRQCASSLQAVISAAFEIAAGEAAVIVAGGVESMSRMPYYLPPTVRYEGFRLGNSQIYDAFSHGVTMVQPEKLYPGLNMGLTAENVAEKYKITREEQDSFAFDSQQKARIAVDAGKFKDEIVPVEVTDGKNRFVFDQDEHPRPGTTMEKLSRLKPVFKEGGTVTAGNSSGMNDGASAVLVMDEKYVLKHGFAPLVRIIAAVNTGVDPRIMGVGPAPAIRKLLGKTGLTLSDIDLIELNEAFAAQSIGVLRELGIPVNSEVYRRINVNGGAIALGHALGNSGTRILTTLIYELRRRGGRYGIATMCIGGGMGSAVLVENCF